MAVRGRLPGLLSATGLAVASGTAVLVGVGPAHAAVVNVSVPAAAGVVTQSATATCPAGEFLTGGGGSVISALGNGDTTMTDIVPNIATASVTVSGRVNAGALPAFTVVGQAMCAPGAIANHQVVQAVSPLNADPTKTQQVLCPGGTRLLSAGSELAGAFGQVFPRRLVPNAALTGAQATAAAAGGFAGAWQLTVYGVCGTPPAGFQLVTVAGGVNNVNPRALTTPACPAGWRTTGVGAELSPAAAGNVVLRQLTANSAQDRATAGAVEDGIFVPAWGLQTFNICWQL